MTVRPPTVSIGMPVYNGERFLKESLDAILAQTFEDFELIISDNASADDTAGICRLYASKDRRIRYSRNEVNIGAAGNFNRVFQLATATHFFRWATADDLFPSNSLEHCVKVMGQYPEAVLCYPKTVLIDEAGRMIRPHDDNLDLRSPNPIERFRSALERIRLVNVQYGLMRSEVMKKTSLFRNYGGGDIPFVLEMTLHGQFIEIPQTVFYRRMHGQASSAIRTVEEEQQFWDPSTRGRLFLRMWKHYLTYLAVALHAPTTFVARGRLVAVVCRSAIMSRHKLMRELFRVVHECLGRMRSTNRAGRETP